MCFYVYEIMSQEELDLQYTPRMWSKRYAKEDVVTKHINVCKTATNNARKEIPCQLDVPYGDTVRQKIDIYGIDLSSDAPIVVYIHGGFWQASNKDAGGIMAKPLYKHGIKLMALGYNLCPEVSFKTLITQSQQGIAYCLKYAKEHKTKGVYLIGHSAGAHLTLSTFQQTIASLSDKDKDLIKAAVLISGVFDLTPVVQTYLNDKLQLNENEAKAFSPIFYNSEAGKHTFFLIIVGEHESTAFHHQSTLMYNKLKNDGYNTNLIFVDGADHFNIVENLQCKHNNIFQLILKLIQN